MRNQMGRKDRRILAFKWAKLEIKRLGVPRRQLRMFVHMYQTKLLNDPNYRRVENE